MSERQAKLRALGDIRKEYQFTLLSNGEGVGGGILGGYVSLINLYGCEIDYKRMNKEVDLTQQVNRGCTAQIYSIKSHGA